MILFFTNRVVLLGKLRRMGWARLVARMAKKRTAYMILDGNPEQNSWHIWAHTGGLYQNVC
jgi:hypothetical protein